MNASSAPLTKIETLVPLLRHRLPPVRSAAYWMLKVLGVEIPRSVVLRGVLRLPHGAVGPVIHPRATIGNNVTLYQGVTLGTADTVRDGTGPVAERDRVVVEDDVVVGAGAKVLARAGQVLTLGRGCQIGANAVVLTSVPPGETWAGIPARPTRPSRADPGTSASA